MGVTLNDNVAVIFYGFVYGLASIEPNTSIWIMAGFGSFGSVMLPSSAQRGIWGLLCNWLVGIFFSLAVVLGVDHWQPESEAFFAGLAFTKASEPFVNLIGARIGLLLAGRLAGGTKFV